MHLLFLFLRQTTEDKPKLPEPRPVEAPVSMPRPVVSAAPPPPVQMQVAPQVRRQTR